MDEEITVETIDAARRLIEEKKIARIGGRSFNRVEKLEEFAIDRGLLPPGSGADLMAFGPDGLPRDAGKILGTVVINAGDLPEVKATLAEAQALLADALARADRAEQELSLARERIAEVEVDWAKKTEELARATARLELFESGNAEPTSSGFARDGLPRHGRPLLPLDFRDQLIALKGIGGNLADQVIALIQSIPEATAADAEPAPPEAPVEQPAAAPAAPDQPASPEAHEPAPEVPAG